jgi:hypothetical protein
MQIMMFEPQAPFHMSASRAHPGVLVRLVLLLALAVAGARIVRNVTDALELAVSGGPSSSQPAHWPTRGMSSNVLMPFA